MDTKKFLTVFNNRSKDGNIKQPFVDKQCLVIGKRIL